MAIEKRRGCGYRAVGGIYVVGGHLTAPCGMLPFELGVCPCCGAGIKPARAWTWINPQLMLKNANPCNFGKSALCDSCVMNNVERFGEKAGMIWIGGAHYRTPQHFMLEANTQGISRRLARNAVPKELELGKTWCFLAHREALVVDGEKRPGVFAIFKPTKLEIIITETQSRDEAFMKRIEERGLTPVVVPDDDPDHNPKGIGLTPETVEA